MWFKKAAPKAPAPESEDDTNEKAPASENGSSNSDSAPTAPIEELTKVTPPVQKKKVIDAASSSSRKLVQRRIHINDPCRVCESARTEDVSRCELRCLGCDMTVHKVCWLCESCLLGSMCSNLTSENGFIPMFLMQKCYDVESEDPIDDWHCRRCQCITDKKEELESADADATPAATESDSALLPTHEPLGKAHKYHELHGDSDFATIFQFLKRFRRMGLKISLDINLKVQCHLASRCLHAAACLDWRTLTGGINAHTELGGRADRAYRDQIHPRATPSAARKRRSHDLQVRIAL